MVVVWVSQDDNSTNSLAVYPQICFVTKTRQKTKKRRCATAAFLSFASSPVGSGHPIDVKVHQSWHVAISSLALHRDVFFPVAKHYWIYSSFFLLTAILKGAVTHCLDNLRGCSRFRSMTVSGFQCLLCLRESSSLKKSPFPRDESSTVGDFEWLVPQWHCTVVGTPKRRSLDSTIGEELYGAGADVDAGMNMDPDLFWDQ